MENWFSLLQFGPDGWGDEIAAGTWLTIRLALATLPLGLAIGLLVAVARSSNRRIPRALGNTFLTVFRGLPELLTLIIIYYGGQALMNRVAGAFGGGYVEVSSFLAGVIALGLVFASYSSEVFIGAWRALPRGQFDAAAALGLPRMATLLRVIFPQFIRLALPGLANLWLVLLKDTSLVSIIALNDLMRETYVAVGATKEPFLFYLTAMGIYLLLSIISSVGIVGVERWSERGAQSR